VTPTTAAAADNLRSRVCDRLLADKSHFSFPDVLLNEVGGSFEIYVDNMRVSNV
jgi:hypothetical protein